jgi:hypothetical protein
MQIEKYATAIDDELNAAMKSGLSSLRGARLFPIASRALSVHV